MRKVLMSLCDGCDRREMLFLTNGQAEIQGVEGEAKGAVLERIGSGEYLGEVRGDLVCMATCCYISIRVETWHLASSAAVDAHSRMPSQRQPCRL